MDVVVRGRNVGVSDRYRAHVEGKLSRAERFGVPIERIDVELSYESNPRQSDRAFEVEFTCRGGGPVIRAEAHAQDKYAATDIALDHLEERLRRVSDRRRNRRTEKVVVMPTVDRLPAQADEQPAGGEDAATEDDDPATVWAEGPIVVRLKEHATVPMSVEQAVEAMELVDHDFYMYRDVDSGVPSVLYRRRGFSYGLIRLEDG